MATNNSKLNNKGYVALITILIILAVCGLIATSILVLGTDWLRTSQTTEDATRARSAADSCTESALGVIAGNNSFTGTGGLTLSATPSVTCSYTVSGSAPIKTIAVTGISNNAIKKISTVTSQLSPNIISSSSQVVP